MSYPNLHKVKCAAHKETWYTGTQPSYIFRRASTWTVGVGRRADSEINATPDVESQLRIQEANIISSEPPLVSGPQGGSVSRWPLHEDGISPTTLVPSMTFNGNKSEIHDMGGTAGNERPCQETIAESQRIKRPPDGEQSADQIFTPKFLHETRNSLRPKRFTLSNQLRATVFNSWINILLIAAPVGIAVHFVNVSPIAVFVINFIAIIPLAALLSYATEEIAIRASNTIGSLLNATFGNAVELIVSIIALVKNQVVIVKTSLIGSILSNLLLVLGMSFFFGGLQRTEQFFNQTLATTAASMLALAIGSIIIPTAFDKFTSTSNVQIAELSRGTAIILLVVYGCYLFFQLKTHSAMYAEEGKKVPIKPRKHSTHKDGGLNGLAVVGTAEDVKTRTDAPDNDQPQHNAHKKHDIANEEELGGQKLHISVAVFTLAASTTLVALCAEFMVESISSITSGNNSISIEFVGLILLPIVGNASEHITAVTVACKDKMDLAIGVTVGSSMQIALLVIPFSIILGWILGNDDMNLSFDGFQIVVLFVSILLVNYLISDGKSNWLEGVLLQGLYLIIAVTSWYYHQSSSG